MALFRDAVFNLVSGAICRAISLGNYPLSGRGVLIDGILQTPQFLSLALQGAVSRLVCNREPPPPAIDPGSGYSGGQCLVAYRVIITLGISGGNFGNLTTPPNGSTFTQTFFLYGNLGQARVVITARNPQANQTVFRLSMFCRGGSGNPPVNNPTSYQDQFIQAPAGVVGANAQIFITDVTVSRLDGQPDNCGNPPPVLLPPPPGWDNFDDNLDYEDEDGNNFVVPVGVIIAPAFISFNGELQIPFQLNFSPEFTLNGTFNIGTGDINFNFSGNYSDGSGDADRFPSGDTTGDNRPDNYTTPNPIPEPPDNDEFEDTEEPEEPRKELVIRAVAVTVSEQLPSTLGTIFQAGGNPDIITPDLGFVQFQVRVGQSTFWTNAIKVNNVRALIPCPWEGGAIDVQGTPRPGVTWFLSPVYAKSEFDSAAREEE